MRVPQVSEICPMLFELNAKCEQFRVFGRNFKRRWLLWYFPWKNLKVHLEDTTAGGGPKCNWADPAPAKIQVNHDGTMLTFETTPSCPPPTHGAGKLTVTVENDETHSRDSKEFDIKFL